MGSIKYRQPPKNNDHKTNSPVLKRKGKGILRKYLTDYKFNSILLRNFILIIVLVILPSTMMSVFYNVNTRSILRDEISGANMNTLYRSSDAVEAVVSELYYFIFNLASFNDDISMFSLSSMDEIHRDSMTKNSMIKRIYNNIKLYTTTNRYVDSVYIYSERNNVVFDNSDGTVSTLEDARDKSWLPAYKSLDSQRFVIESSRKNNFYPYYITLICPLNYGKVSEITGAVILNINIEKLGQIIGSSGHSNQEFFLVDDSMRLYYSSDYRIVGNQDYAPEYLHFLMDYPERFSEPVTIDGQEVMVSSLRSDRFHWRYVLLSPLSVYESKMEQTNRFILQMTALYLLLGLAVSFILTLRSFKPVHNIIHMLENPAPVNEEYIFDKRNGNEVKHITSLVRRTQMQNSILKMELDERLDKLNNAQMAALQSQIDPHFLYNTLDIISWMAIEKMGGSNEVSTMISTLAQLLRCSLQRDSFLVNVEEEIEHTMLYVKILECRYRDRLKVHWDIGDGIRTHKILKLSLQPLVENALNHGLKPKRYHGNIYIKCALIGSAVVVSVEDDGVGMDEKTWQELNNQLKTEYQYDDKHIGIRNINQRVKLLFGDKYGVIIGYKEKGCGLTVTVVFPQETVYEK